MRPVLRIATLLISAATFGHGAEANADTKRNEPAASPPNIILCMADDQGWGDVAYNGHPLLKTPTLDEMAATGLRFDRFYAAAPVCSPTRGSVMTGRHPNRFACFSWGHTLRPQEITLAEAVKSKGYATGHFGKWHLGPVDSRSPVSPGNSGFDEWFSSPNFYENNPLMSHNGKVVETQGEGSQVTVDAALEFIRESAQKKQPFLAVVWFGSPHTPHIAVEEDLQTYRDQPARVQNYLGEITAMDRAMKHLRDELRTLGIADNTLLWYTSDNGALSPGSTGGLSGQKGTLREGGIRVPAIIEWPAVIKSPRTVKTPCGTVDIYPTILDLLGITMPNQPGLDGVSLRSLIAGEEFRRSKPLGFWVYPAPGRPVRSHQILQALAREQAAGVNASVATSEEPEESRQTYPRDERPGPAAWIDGDYKLHRVPANTGETKYTLFNLAADPEEKNDLSSTHPERLKQMQTALEAWQKSVLQSLNGNDYPSDRK